MSELTPIRGLQDPALHIIRARRKTIALRVLPDLTVELRVPQRMTRAEMARFLEEKSGWIEKHRRLTAQRLAQAPPVEKLTEEELRALTERAKEIIPARAAHFAPIVGVSCGRVTIRHQRSRWGSCSSRGNLNFNCLLLLTPPEVLDSVVVHELCHLKEMNHSPRFYAEVLRVFPDYRRCDDWLRRNGGAILRRL